MVEVVIAKYKENLDWVSSLNSSYKVSIYSKDENEEIDYPKLPNIGRESHTYIHHIIENFETLEDYTIFTQGDPFPHKSDFLEYINVLDFTKINKFLPIGVGTYVSDFSGNPNHSGLPCGAYREEFTPYATELKFYPGALFVLTKKAIQEKGIQYYRRLNDYHYADHNFPWIIERYWGMLFGYKYE